MFDAASRSVPFQVWRSCWHRLFFKAVFFTYALVLVNFYRVPAKKTGWYILALAPANFFGPLVLGRLFDSIGRKPMIIATHRASGVLLIITGYLFGIGALTAHTQAIAWTVIFFISSSSASAAYLTVSEIFPLQIRSLAIAFFYACGTLAGGVAPQPCSAAALRRTSA